MNESDDTGGEPVTLEELIALSEGDLSADQATALRERISTDPRAEQLLAELTDTDQILEAVRKRPVPPDLAQSITDLIAREQERREAQGQADEDTDGDDAAPRGAGSPDPS